MFLCTYVRKIPIIVINEIIRDIMDRDGTTSLDNYLAEILPKLKFVCVYVFVCMCMCVHVLICAYRCFKKENQKGDR